MRRLAPVVAVVAALCAACSPPPQKMLDATPKPTAAPTTTVAGAPGTTAAPTTTPAPADPNATTTTAPTDPLQGITIADESEPAGYSRDRFKHWTKDSQGCTTRERVLKAESATPAQVDPYGCKVLAGDWDSVYDDVKVTDPAELDVDHMVPLHEAWQSGAAGWSDAEREAYANDDKNAESLRAVTAASNRSKGDNDPHQWIPNNGKFLCQYVTEWVTVKRRYKLSIDPAEAGTLRKIFAACPAANTQAAAATSDEGGLDPMAMLLIAAIGLSMMGGGSSSRRSTSSRRRR